MSSEPLLPPDGIRQRGPVVSGTQLMLIRHGESVANSAGVAGGALGDGGLTPLGRLQARTLSTRLTMTGEFAAATAFYTSVLPRARATAALLAPALPSGLALATLEDVDELRVGEGDGLSWSEFAERFNPPNWDVDPHLENAPGGESLLSFYARVISALALVAERHPAEMVVVVCHGGVIEQAVKWSLGLEPGRRLQSRIEHCSLTEIEVSGEYRRLLRYNDQSPLPNH
ncbi:MAG: histidine phosphatase family protein [Actinomycetes bacterium]